MATTTLTPTSASSENPKLVKKASSSSMDGTGPSLATQTAFGCQHIKGLLQNARDKATDGYGRLIQALRKQENASDRLHRSGDQTRATGQTTYLCLQCRNVSLTRTRHRKEHAFSVESKHGFVFCHECKDFVYDPTFEEIRSSNGKKRKAAELCADGDQQRLVATNSTATPCAATGLRGIYNMGQTCFMSVILQSLIHNPLIRTFYLSEGHRGDCERDACTSCALDEIFSEFFGQEKHGGYGAVHMLQGCWKGGGGLAGYNQQDAHEYLGFILNSLHSAITDEDESGTGTGSGSSQKDDATKDCDCIIHQTFGGLYKSTVTCSNCKNVTTAHDPFMDLSLDIRSSPVATKKKLALINGTTTVKETPPMDLAECLDRFTSPETLSSDSYHCRTCASSQEAKKKLSLSRLPPVIPIHLKRFSHSKTLATSSKVGTKIRFPFDLDLTPYTTASPAGSGGKNKTENSKANGASTTKDVDTPSKPGKASSSGPDMEDKEKEKDGGGGSSGSGDAKSNGDGDNHPSSSTKSTPEAVYELSSVVVHKGKIDNGHYISYSKQGDEWFRFDDSMVVQVDEKEVLGAEAYMLFYVAREFEST